MSYFPAGRWVDINNLGSIVDMSSGGDTKNLIDRYILNVHLKEKFILPYQYITGSYSIANLLKTPITLIAFRDS